MVYYIQSNARLGALVLYEYASAPYFALLHLINLQYPTILSNVLAEFHNFVKSPIPDWHVRPPSITRATHISIRTSST